MNKVWRILLLFFLLYSFGCVPKNSPPLNPDLFNAVTGSQIINIVPVGANEQMQLRPTYGALNIPLVYNSYQWNYPDDAYYQSTKVFIFESEKNCGDYRVTVLINGIETVVYATLCQLPDDTWRLMAVRAL